jgi:hypothetical protein
MGPALADCQRPPTPALAGLTLEQANQRVTARSSIQPQRDRIIGRIPSRLKKPEEGMNIRRQVNEARVRIDSWCCFANASFPWLLISDCDIVWGSDRCHSRRINWQLPRKLAEFWPVKGAGSGASKESCQQWQTHEQSHGEYKQSGGGVEWSHGNSRRRRN